MENNTLYLMNNILTAAMEYKHTEETVEPISKAIYEYLAAMGYGDEYVVYADDDMNLKIMYQRPVAEENIIDVDTDTPIEEA